MIFKLCVFFLIIYSISAQANLSFDENIFKNEIAKRLGGKSVGLAVAVTQNGSLVTEYTYGKAKSNIDGNKKMTAVTDAYVGSVTKFLTGMTLLRLLERSNTTFNPDGLSANQLLNRKIHLYFPKAWKNRMHNSWKNVNFRQLLQHKSGVRVDKNRAYLTIQTAIKFNNISVRSYNNANFEILGYLLPIVKNPQILKQLNLSFPSSNQSELIRQFLGKKYETIMSKDLMQATIPRFKMTCDPTNIRGIPYRNPIALLYTQRFDPLKGHYYSSIENHNHCRGQGSYYLSSRDLAAVVANLSSGKLISKNFYRALVTPAGNDTIRDNRLVWSFELSNSYLKSRFGWNKVPYSGGDHTIPRPNTEGTYKNVAAHATIVKLPGKFHAVAIINSTEMGSRSLSEELTNAFVEAIK